MKKVFALTIAVFLLSNTSVFSGDSLKTVSKVTMMMGEGQPALERFSTSWISPKGIRSEYDGGMHFLFRAEDSSFYLLYPEKKEYSKVEADKIQPFVSMVDGITGDVTAAGEFTGKTEKVNDWDAKVWKYTMSTTNGWNMSATTWDSTAYLWSSVGKKYFEEFLKLQGKRSELTKQMMKSDGMPLKMVGEMTMAGQKMIYSFVVTEISEEPIPDSMFEIPVDYKEIPMNQKAYWDAFLF